jgi:hypothetical protein
MLQSETGPETRPYPIPTTQNAVSHPQVESKRVNSIAILAAARLRFEHTPPCVYSKPKPGHIDDAAHQGIGIAAIRPIFCVGRKSGASLSSERCVRTCVWRITDSGEISKSPHAGRLLTQAKAAPNIGLGARGGSRSRSNGGHLCAQPNADPGGFYLLAAIRCLYVTASELRSVLKQREVTGETICMAVSVYLLIGFSWALLYAIIFQRHPESFAGIVTADSSQPTEFQHFFPIFGYFSLTTLSTIGFGDITPLTLQARYAAVAEGITGQFYLAILLARLVGLQMSQHSESP